jgi:hypothetical protein
VIRNCRRAMMQLVIWIPCQHWEIVSAGIDRPQDPLRPFDVLFLSELVNSYKCRQGFGRHRGVQRRVEGGCLVVFLLRFLHDRMQSTSLTDMAGQIPT